MAKLTIFAFTPCVDRSILSDTGCMPESTAHLLHILNVNIVHPRLVSNALWLEISSLLFRLRLLQIHFMSKLSMIWISHGQETPIVCHNSNVVFATRHLSEMGWRVKNSRREKIAFEAMALGIHYPSISCSTPHDDLTILSDHSSFFVECIDALHWNIFKFIHQCWG